jgi:16S rRNA processing protein RimM
LVRFQGIEDRAAAEGIRGALFVSSEALRDLEEGEFWTHELTGCSVVSTDGHIVGTVDSVIANPGQDLLVVATGSGEVLVPAVAPIVVEVDVAARRVTIDPPEGLLDL